MSVCPRKRNMEAYCSGRMSSWPSLVPCAYHPLVALCVVFLLRDLGWVWVSNGGGPSLDMMLGLSHKDWSIFGDGLDIRRCSPWWCLNEERDPAQLSDRTGHHTRDSAEVYCGWTAWLSMFSCHWEVSQIAAEIAVPGHQSDSKVCIPAWDLFISHVSVLWW